MKLVSIFVSFAKCDIKHHISNQIKQIICTNSWKRYMEHGYFELLNARSLSHYTLCFEISLDI